MKTNINSIKGLFCGVLLTCGFAGHGVAEPTPAPADKPAARADEGKFKWFDDGKSGMYYPLMDWSHADCPVKSRALGPVHGFQFCPIQGTGRTT